MLPLRGFTDCPEGLVQNISPDACFASISFSLLGLDTFTCPKRLPSTFCVCVYGNIRRDVHY